MAPADFVDNPQAARPADILTLQRKVGNRAVQGWLARRQVQPKISVGPAGDRYEQEADRVADQVLTMPAPTANRPHLQRMGDEDEPVQAKPLATSITPLIRRQVEEEEEPLQAKSLVQRQAEEEEPLQAKPLVQRQAEEEEPLQAKAQDPRAGFDAGQAVEGQLQSAKGHGSSLPTDVRAYMEPRFGTDFGGVRVHTDSQAAQLNRQLSAQAFTHGHDIYVGEGKYHPGSDDGRRLLAHELTHVVQQTGGAPLARKPVEITPARVARRVQRLMTARGIDLNAGDPDHDEELKHVRMAVERYHEDYQAKAEADLLISRLEMVSDFCESWLLKNPEGGRDADHVRTGHVVEQLKTQSLREIQALESGRQKPLSEPVYDPNRLMTAAELQKATGIKRRIWGIRHIVRASYDKIIGLLEEYEDLKKEDPGGKKSSKGLEILKDVLDAIDAWMVSTSRATFAKGDLGKIKALHALHAQVMTERSALLLLDPRAHEKTGQVSWQTPLPKGLQVKEPKPLTLGQKVKAFFAGVGPRIKNTFKYTFGTDFRPDYAICLSGKTLTLEEMQDMVDLIGEAMVKEQELLADRPDDKLGALSRAYMFMPDQLRPKTPDPEERAVLKVKRQLFEEAIRVEKVKKTPPQRLSKWQKFKKYLGLGVKTTLEVGAEVPGVVGTVGKGVSVTSGGVESLTDKLTKIGDLGSKEELSYLKDVEKAANLAGKVGGDKLHKGVQEGGREALGELVKGHEGLKQTADITGKIAGISGAVGAFGSGLQIVIKLFRGDLLKLRSKDQLERMKARDTLKAVVPDALTFFRNSIKSGLEVAKAFGAVIPTQVMPIVGAVISFISMIANIIEGLQKIIRSIVEALLRKEAKQKAQALATAIGAFAKRNFQLAVRSALKIIADALRVIGNILTVIPDPSGSTQAIGLVIGYVGTALDVVNTVSTTFNESYRAGLRQSAERRAEAGVEGSAKKVMKQSPTYAATALILEAKDDLKHNVKDSVAVRALKNYGLHEDTIRDASVERLRERLFIELQEKEEALTLTQKVKKVFNTVGLASRL